MACCSCCLKTGACCNAGVCSEETCADCESAGGVFQGVDTECSPGDECPCDPPASPSICEKCVDGVPTDYCPETDCCTDGTCKPCPPPYCPEEPCTGDDCCVDGQCVTCPEYDCDPECGSGQCCVGGVCVTCVACDPGDCPSGQCCVDGFCTDCPPRECPDPPCPSGECCIDGYCINPCPEGEYCCNGVCQEEPCDSECSGACTGDADCEPGCRCCAGECATGYCHYYAEIRWVGVEDPEDIPCPTGWLLGQVGQGEKQCFRCETVQETECDEQAWYSSVTPDQDWELILNSLSVTGDCEATRCAGACDPEGEFCCPGCTCAEVEPDVYECVAEEPPP